jgi:hypothetical protein
MENEEMVTQPPESKPGEMTSTVHILERLRLKRQDNEFLMTPEGFTAGKGKYYNPEDLTIIKTFRFEGDSNPDDSSIIYLIEAKDGLIGYSMDAYGVYSNHDDDKYDEFIKQIPKEDRDVNNILN